ncbi:hypothetical protein QF037_009159 [Streptomyces canus]|uniref:hypothetical protein n=1 Tax=Streptomyces canus TaxID=58343 RepID=UPI002788C941|nr:hypothetical protein [Streptomyces canus]MDQ0604814.1 hypothetical protein [Streptomyces canus]
MDDYPLLNVFLTMMWLFLWPMWFFLLFNVVTDLFRTDAEWARIRRGLCFGQVFEGTVVKIPRPGAVGIFVNIGLSVGGFVDVVWLPEQSDDWPTEGTVADFEIWWADGRQQIRLRPLDSRYQRNDFADSEVRFRPGWPSEVGQPVLDPGPPNLDEVRSALRSDGTPTSSS